jgi:hypothetical protein
MSLIILTNILGVEKNINMAAAAAILRIASVSTSKVVYFYQPLKKQQLTSLGEGVLQLTWLMSGKEKRDSHTVSLSLHSTYLYRAVEVWSFPTQEE